MKSCTVLVDLSIICTERMVITLGRFNHCLSQVTRLNIFKCVHESDSRGTERSKLGYSTSGNESTMSSVFHVVWLLHYFHPHGRLGSQGHYKTKHWQRTKVQKKCMRHMMALCLTLVKLQCSGEKMAFSKIADGYAHGKV